MFGAFVCVGVFGQSKQDPYLLHIMLSGLPVVVLQVLGKNISVLLDLNGLAAINVWIYFCRRIDRRHA
jgi:branched-subunit amino acid transport protein